MNTGINGGRRSCIELMAEILEEAKQGVSKTRLVYRTSLNFALIQKHLIFLLDKGFLEIEEPAKFYITTSKGIEFLDHFKRMKQMLGKEATNEVRYMT